MSSRSWRKEYYQLAIHQFKKISGDISNMPEEIELPISDKQCMFEFGGSKHASGSALIISTASGFPNSALVLHNRHPNGLHVCSRVWPGTLLGIATHKYGFINIGIYKVESSNEIKKYASELSLIKASLLAGGTHMEYPATINFRWLIHLEKKYPGIRKLAQATIDKLLDFRCTTPMYIEPFKVLRTTSKYDANFSKLLTYTDLVETETTSNLLPYHAVISSNMKNTLEYNCYLQFESELIKQCKSLYELQKPFIYLYLNHLLFNKKFITKAFIAYQDKDSSILKFLRKEFIYNHIGYETNHSFDFESFILSNYNPTYMTILFGIKSGGIAKVLDLIESSKNRCISVPLKYSLCTKKYI